MRKASVLSLLLIVIYMTAGVGVPILTGGKLAISNLTPIAFIAVAAVFYLSRNKSMDVRVAWFILLFNVSCLASFVIFLAKYDWTPNFPVLFFEDVELTFCVLLWWFGTENPSAFSAAVKLGIYASIPVSVLYALYDLHTGAGQFGYGMDDKSQGAVLLCCEAYVLIRFFGGKLGRLAGGALYVASFATISRLPVFFFPAIVLGLMRRSRMAAAVTAVATCAAAYIVITAGSFVQESFAVYNRLSSMQAIADSGSTEAHLELLKAALQIKFTEPLAFVFGTGPDNFSKALFTVPSALDKLGGLDPQLIEYALMGKAPLHSTPMQVLLDYNIALFMLFVFFLARAFRFLIRRRVTTDLAFASGLLLASCFYSLHNKPYFYLYLVTTALLITVEDSGAAPRYLDERAEQGKHEPRE